MRKFTWKEQIIDKHFNGALSTWCEAIESAIRSAPDGTKAVAICRSYEVASEIEKTDSCWVVIVEYLPEINTFQPWVTALINILAENGFPNKDYVYFKDYIILKAF